MPQWMNIPNFASSYHSGTGRAFSDSNVGAKAIRFSGARNMGWPDAAHLPLRHARTPARFPIRAAFRFGLAQRRMNGPDQGRQFG
jgi:hypothetical protein